MHNWIQNIHIISACIPRESNPRHWCWAICSKIHHVSHYNSNLLMLYYSDAFCGVI